jgi:hypothetical protein
VIILKRILKDNSVKRCEIGRNHSEYDGRICCCVEGNEPLKFHTNKEFINQLDDHQVVSSTVFYSVCNPKHEDRKNVSLPCVEPGCHGNHRIARRRTFVLPTLKVGKTASQRTHIIRNADCALPFTSSVENVRNAFSALKHLCQSKKEILP